MIVDKVLVILYQQTLLVLAESAGCEFDSGKDKLQPVIIEEDGNQEVLLQSTLQKNKTFLYGMDTLEMTCPNNHLATIPTIGNAKCKQDKKFYYIKNNKEVLFNTVTCLKSNPFDSVTNSCERLIEIGFQEAPGRFIKISDTSFDNELKKTLYSGFTLEENYISNTPVLEKTMTFKKTCFESMGIDNVYDPDTQRKTINLMLGLQNQDLEYINTNYLSRGPLTLYGDFNHVSLKMATSYSRSEESDCEVHSGEDKLQPLIVKKDGDQDVLLQPTLQEYKIFLLESDTLEITCPNNHIVTATGPTIGDAKCKEDKKFYYIDNIKEVLFNTVTCIKSNPFDSVRNACESLMEIGFQVAPDRFIKSIDISFDNQLKKTLYSHFILEKSDISNAPDTGKPTVFKKTCFESMGIDNVYKKETQRKTINSLLGLPDQDRKYINANYLNRGHLTPYGDFKHIAFKLATNYYINVAPQWKKFNEGNWNNLENCIRNYAKDKKLEIYTGTYDVLTLPKQGDVPEDTDLYLYVDEAKQQVPVPLLIWKVIYDGNGAGMAFAGVNSPYLEFSENHKAKLNDLNSVNNENCKNAEFLQQGFRTGYMFCCSIKKLTDQIVLPIPDYMHVDEELSINFNADYKEDIN